MRLSNTDPKVAYSRHVLKALELPCKLYRERGGGLGFTARHCTFKKGGCAILVNLHRFEEISNFAGLMIHEAAHHGMTEGERAGARRSQTRIAAIRAGHSEAWRRRQRELAMKLQRHANAGSCKLCLNYRPDLNKRPRYHCRRCNRDSFSQVCHHCFGSCDPKSTPSLRPINL